MRLAKLDLKQIIQEEMQKILQEDMPVRSPFRDTDVYSPRAETARPDPYPEHFIGVEGDPFKKLGEPAVGSVEDPLETTLWPIPGDPVYATLGNLPSALYGEAGAGPGGEWGDVPNPDLEWPYMIPRSVPYIPGLSPEETAAYYEREQFAQDAPYTPYVGKKFPIDEEKSNLKKIIKEEYDKLLSEVEVEGKIIDISAVMPGGMAPFGIPQDQWEMVGTSAEGE